MFYLINDFLDVQVKTLINVSLFLLTFKLKNGFFHVFLT